MSEVGTLVSTVCRQLNTRGLCPRPGTGIAIQKDGKVYMAPDNIPMDRLTTEDLFIFNSKLDKNGDPDVVKKSRPKAGTTAGPSPFTKLYLGLFEQKPSVRSIVVSQAVSAVLVAKINENKFTFKENEMISSIIDPVRKVPLGWEDEVVVPIVENTDDVKALLESIKTACTETKDANAVIIRNNGIVVWGEDWTLARNMLDSYLYLMDLSLEMKKFGLGNDGPVSSPALPIPTVQEEKSVAGGSEEKPKETVETPPKRKKVETPETNKRTENSYKKSPYVKPVVDLALRKKKAALNRLRQDTMPGSGHVPFSSITLSGATGHMSGPRIGPMSGNMGPMVSPSNGPKVDTMNGPNVGQKRNSVDRPMNGPNMGPMRSASDLGPMNNQNSRGPMGRSESMNGPQGMGSMNGPQGMGPMNNQNNMGSMGRPGPMNGPQGMGPVNNQNNMMNNQNNMMNTQNMGPMGRSGPMNGPPGLGQINGPPGMGPMNGPQGMGPMSGQMGMGPGPNNMGPVPNNMGPGPNNMGPGPNNMGPGPNNMGPGPNTMGPGPSNMGPRGSSNHGPMKGGNRFNDRFNKFLKNDKPEGSRRGGEGGGTKRSGDGGTKRSGDGGIKRSGDASAGQPHKSTKFSPKKGATKSREKFKSIRPEDY